MISHSKEDSLSKGGDEDVTRLNIKLDYDEGFNKDLTFKAFKRCHKKVGFIKYSTREVQWHCYWLQFEFDPFII